MQAALLYLLHRSDMPRQTGHMDPLLQQSTDGHSVCSAGNTGATEVPQPLLVAGAKKVLLPLLAASSYEWVLLILILSLSWLGRLRHGVC
jgi:hypothetical protein